MLRQPLVVACLSLLGAALVAAGTCSSSNAANDAVPAWYRGLDEDARDYVSYYFSRQVPVRIYGSPEFSFQHAERPTVMLNLGGNELPLLFDTGTYTCILRLGDDELLPSGMEVVPDGSGAAWLENKRLTEGTVSLSYALAGTLRLSDVRMRDVPFRIYRGGQGGGADYAGALSPMLFHEYIIECDNDAQLIRLHEPEDYLPPEGALVLPVLTLPRGLFIPLTLDGEQLWFHLDTGFSGTLGVLPDVIDRHQAAIVPKDTVSEFGGWRGKHAYSELMLTITLAPYPHLDWARDEPVEVSLKGLAYADRYAELTGYNIGGIIGSGLLATFRGYSLDLIQGRIYLLPWGTSDYCYW